VWLTGHVAEMTYFSSVYRVPPRTSNEGYKAANWNSDQGLLWQGRIRVIEKGKACEIRLEDPNSGMTPSQTI
jgi:hypothetical protein